MNLTPTIYLPGKCLQAIAFYQNVLNAELVSLRRVGDVVAAEHIRPGTADMIMRAILRLDQSVLYLADGHDSGERAFHGVSLSLAYPSRAEAENVFRALSEGGQVRVPIRETALAPVFGSVFDQFGVHWTVEMSAGPVA